MKKGVIWIALSFLIVASMVLASCGSAKTTSTQTTTTTSAAATTTTTSTAIVTTSTTSTAVVTTAVSTTSTGNWWDSLGIPQYGGQITIRVASNIASFDPYNSESLLNTMSGWMERLHTDYWTMDPSVWNYVLQFRPSNVVSGQLAESFEFTDPSTYVVHLRQNVYWQNITPVNGRQFTSADVVFAYDRLFGLGDGFTTRDTFMTYAGWNYLVSVTATDKYTVVFKWSAPSPEFISETLQTCAASSQCIEAPEAVQQWGNLNDWHHAIGTGPFILTDFVDSTSETLVKNPNYWGYDERYPQNKLPYVNDINILIIPNVATAMAALRSGKIDSLDNMTSTQVPQLQATNSELIQTKMMSPGTLTVAMRNDVKPFTDLNVRIALQMAIDLPTIAKTYYLGDCSPNPSSLTTPELVGWGYPYTQWPASLKAQYAYNPTQAKALLAAAGYPNGFNTNVVADSSSDLTLLQIVQSYFADIGVNMSINLMDSAAWTSFVQTSHSHTQMAYRASGQLALAYEPIRQLNNYRPGYSTDGINMVNDPIYTAFFDQAMAATTVDAAKQVVKNANEYVAQQHFVISLLQTNVYAFAQPWLKGYSAQYGAISQGNLGPQVLGFYGARFWINRN